jgi:hypothetical protein
MERKLLITILSFLAILNFNKTLYSQSALQTFSNLTSEAAVEYSQPAITAFGAGMNSGWFSGLPSSANSFHWKLRIIGVGSFFNDKRTFSTVTSFNFSSEQVDQILLNSGITPSNTPNYDEIKDEILAEQWEVTLSGPTIIGSNDEYLQVDFPGGNIQGYDIESQSVIVPEVTGLLNNKEFLPTPAVQLDFSSIFGTGVSFRYFNGIQLQNVGKINILGAGIVHNINYWFSEPFTVDVGIGYFFQRFKVGDIFNNSTSQFGIYVSKQFGAIVSFVPYMSLTSESSQTNINYKYTFDTPSGPQDLQISVDYDSDTTIALIIGAAINLPVISLNLDYKISETHAGTIGIGIGF